MRTITRLGGFIFGFWETSLSFARSILNETFVRKFIGSTFINEKYFPFDWISYRTEEFLGNNFSKWWTFEEPAGLVDILPG